VAETPEGKLKELVYDYLRKNGWYVRVIAVGVIPGMSNPMKGMPDAIGIKNGTVVFFELKSPKGKLSPDQERFIFEWTSHGGNAFVVRSLEDAQRIVGEANRRSRLKGHQCPLGVDKCTRSLPPSV